MNLQHVSPDKGLRTSKRSIVMTMFVMALTVISSFAQNPEIKKALRLIDIEQPTKGIQALEQLAKSNPESSSHQYYLGLGYIRTGNKEKALEAFEKGIKLNEKDGLNYAGKGHVRLLEKNPTDAKANLDKALQLSRSKDAIVLRAVGAAYINDTKFLLDAINALNKAKTINGADPETHMLLGDALLLQNQQQGGEAVSSFERAAKADQKSGKPFYKIGKIFQRARNNDEAIKFFNQSISVDAEYAPSYKELGQIYYVNKQADKAVEAYEKYLTLTENPADAKFQLAFFYFMAKRYDKADAIFNEVLSNPNVSPIAWRYKAYSLTEQGKPTDQNKAGDPAKLSEASKAFEQYFKKAKPEDIQAQDYAYLGNLYLYQKTAAGDSLANMNFAKSLELDSMQFEIAQDHAETYFRRKKYPEAITVYKQLLARKDQPSTADLFNLGRSYYYNQQFTQADSAFTKVAERAPNMTVGYQWAAKARTQIDSTGAQGLANAMYDSLIEKSLANPEKYKKELIEAYYYFSMYYIGVKEDVAKAKPYLEKILALDPNHAKAKEAIQIINEPPKTPTKGTNKGGKK
jgi:tetratricopeptide (TPR) repeat protein